MLTGQTNLPDWVQEMGFSLRVCSQLADNLGQASSSLSLAFAFIPSQPGQARSRRSLGFLLVSFTSCKAVGADAVYPGYTLTPLGRVRTTFILLVFITEPRTYRGFRVMHNTPH